MFALSILWNNKKWGCKYLNYFKFITISKWYLSKATVKLYDKLSDMCVIGKFICIQQSCSFIVILYLYSDWQWCMVYALIHFTTGASGRLALGLPGRRGVTPCWHTDWLYPLHLLNNVVYCFIIVAESTFVLVIGARRIYILWLSICVELYTFSTCLRWKKTLSFYFYGFLLNCRTTYV